MSFDSFKYWENRYKSDSKYFGKDWNKRIKMRADYINNFIKNHNLKKVFDYGCGDGRHSRHIIVEDYLGIDISEDAIRECKKLNPGKTFYLAKKNDNNLRKLLKEFKPELSLSLWTISHLIEDEIFKEYMNNLFYAKRFVIIHEINEDKYIADYQLRRDFVKYIGRFKNWQLLESDKICYIYERNGC